MNIQRYVTNFVPLGEYPAYSAQTLHSTAQFLVEPAARNKPLPEFRLLAEVVQEMKGRDPAILTYHLLVNI